MKHRSLEDITITTISYVFLTLIAVSTLVPFANILSKAVSEEWAVVSGRVGLLPVGFQLDTMKFVITSKEFLNSFRITLFITIVGTLSAVLMTAITAYPLSKKGLKGVKFVIVLYVFTMLFNGGLIPNYMLIRKLNLIDNLAALILPGLINVFNMLVIKNYYESLPESLEESAKLDGASNITVLFRIIIPLSKPTIATISLFYVVGFWNDFFNPMMYINSQALRPLQLYLRGIVMEINEIAAGGVSVDELMNVSPESVRSATIIAATVPILLVYPYLQKFFIKGILIGSVKE